MDESRLMEMGIVSASMVRRASRRLTPSPVASMVDRVRKRVHATKIQQEKEISAKTFLQQEQEDMDHPPRTSSFGWRKTHGAKPSTASKLSRTSSIGTFVTAPDSPHSLIATNSPPKATKRPANSGALLESEIEVEPEPDFNSVAPSDTNLFTHPEAELEAETTTNDFSVKPKDPVTPDNASECSSIVTLTPSFNSEISLTSTNLAFFPTPPRGFEKGHLQPYKPTSVDKRTWKDMTDDVVKGYLVENYRLTARLDRLKERAQEAGQDDYEQSCDAMMTSATKNMFHIMHMGDLIHNSIDAHVKAPVAKVKGSSSGSSNSSRPRFSVNKEGRLIARG